MVAVIDETDETVNVNVRAEREGRLWVLYLEDGGVTQTRKLTNLEAMVADYVSLTRDVAAKSVQVTLMSIDPGGGLADEITAAQAAQAEAARATESAAARVRDLATALLGRGLSGVEIGRVLGVSPQRVSQLTAQTRGPGTSAAVAAAVVGRSTTQKAPVTAPGKKKTPIQSRDVTAAIPSAKAAKRKRAASGTFDKNAAAQATSSPSRRSPG